MATEIMARLVREGFVYRVAGMRGGWRYRFCERDDGFYISEEFAQGALDGVRDRAASAGVVEVDVDTLAA